MMVIVLPIVEVGIEDNGKEKPTAAEEITTTVNFLCNYMTMAWSLSTRNADVLRRVDILAGRGSRHSIQ